MLRKLGFGAAADRRKLCVEVSSSLNSPSSQNMAWRALGFVVTYWPRRLDDGGECPSSLRQRHSEVALL
jgi:hypothetical protein